MAREIEAAPDLSALIPRRVPFISMIRASAGLSRARFDLVGQVYEAYIYAACREYYIEVGVDFCLS